MSRGIFVTGTDTGVGKTLAACALVHALRAAGREVAPMKPVAAGAREVHGRWINDDTLGLLAAAGWELERSEDVTPVLLREPMAPHIAAAHEGRSITLAALLAAFERLTRDGFVVAEGVGGFHVPLGDRLDSAQLAAAMGLPVVLVVGLRLGCLNHALLTTQAVAAAGLPLVGWIANELDPGMAALEENISALRERLTAPLLGRLPRSPSPDALGLSRHLDVTPLL